MSKDTYFKHLREADPNSVYTLIREKDNKEGLLLTLNVGIYVLTFAASVYMLINIKISFVQYFSALTLTMPTAFRLLIKLSFYNSLAKVKGHTLIKFLGIVIVTLTFALLFLTFGYILIVKDNKDLNFWQCFFTAVLLLLSFTVQIFDMIFWTYSKPKEWGSENDE
ncbi:hypothetical protein [Lentilactobacillus buchneri]|uniref:hypothetical protein n=1 Tax=Lentilactobacillus buchneri TaxID=1581 RepID=UPI0002075EFE|nr:hypothetical protein [Lentilactobacillus buchneri]AEB73643.1 hypothetical protein Lbuc_1389 [Lentilactobacillus buchneri NRRL B-30929]